MSYTKATVADVAAAQQAAARTGAAATDAGGRAAEDAAQMQAGIERVTDALSIHFRRIAEALHQEARTASNQLGTADWEGRSQQMASAAETALQSALTNTLLAAEAGTERFRTAMTTEAVAFVTGVRGQFHVVLQNIDQAFQDLAGAEAAFAANLQEADGSAHFDG